MELLAHIVPLSLDRSTVTLINQRKNCEPQKELMRLNSLFAFSAVLAVGALLSPESSFATPVSGAFGIEGGGAGAIGFSLNFNCAAGVDRAFPCPTVTAGNFLVTQGIGDFAPYLGQGGFVESLNPTIAPPNQTINLTNFVTFSSSGSPNPVATPDIALDLNKVLLGSEGPAECGLAAAPGQNCTPNGIAALVSPANPLGTSVFNFSNTQTGVTVSFSVNGTARRLSTGETSMFTGIFSANFIGTNYQALFAALNAGLTISTPYSATFQVTPSPIVPEPATLSLALGGLLVLAGAAFRRSFRR
jgi:hypothetical protein